MGLTNVKLMVPFCRTLDEARLVGESWPGTASSADENGLELYMMVEIPSNVILLAEFAEYFDGFSIGSNDLTQLMLGVDRDSEIVAHVFDERNEAVQRADRAGDRAGAPAGRKIGICGQAPSDYPEFARFLVECGIDSMSLNPDAVLPTTRVVLEAEARDGVPRCLSLRMRSSDGDGDGPRSPRPHDPRLRRGVFDVRQLTKIYRMGEVEVHALREVTLTLPEGEFVVLLGPSGSGKSTLLNILGGLDVPTSGQVLYRGTDLTQADEAELTAYRRRHVGFVFQFYNLIPSLTALENVALVTDISPSADAAEARGWSISGRGAITFPRSSPAANSSAWRLRARSRSGPRCCCATNPPAPSTFRPASWCSRRSRASTPSSARPPS